MIEKKHDWPIRENNIKTIKKNMEVIKNTLKKIFIKN